MGAETKIEWCDKTFNAWVGCTKVSPACDHCYAEAWARRSGQVEWGNAPRKRTSENYWNQPLKWNRWCEQNGVRHKVFCCSLADVFDNQADWRWRAELWTMIAATPHLDWLLLTKRPQNITKMLPHAYQMTVSALIPWPWPNVWLGTTVENQEEADRRIPQLLAVPAAKHFLSCEPLLGPVDLTRYIVQGWVSDSPTPSEIDWVICGGESGSGARTMVSTWARSLRDQCNAAGVAFFMKQMGGTSKRSMAPIPDDLMVREFPGG
jgi:protein gp37